MTRDRVWMTVAECAVVAEVPASTIFRWVALDIVKNRTVHGRILVNQDEVRQLGEARRKLSERYKTAK